MAFRIIDTPSENNVAKRVLISGPPNTLKTTSLLTWPRPLHIIFYPGEKGHETVTDGMEGVKKYVWEFEDPSKTSPASVVREIERLTSDIVIGKHGEVATLAGDGLHKLYGWYYAKCFADLLASAETRKGWDGDDDKLRGRAYGQAHDEFSLYLTKTLATKVPYMAMTVWEGRQKDNPEDLAKNAPTHIFPDLPGQMANRIVGEFSVVLYSEVSPIADLKGQLKGQWQIRPGGKVWGVGVKVSPEIAQSLPAKLPQDFPTLERLLRTGKRETSTQATPATAPSSPNK